MQVLNRVVFSSCEIALLFFLSFLHLTFTFPTRLLDLSAKQHFNVTLGTIQAVPASSTDLNSTSSVQSIQRPLERATTAVGNRRIVRGV